MKIHVIRDLCTGHARCNEAAPEIFKLDEDGYCVIGELQIEVAQQSKAIAGASACPERAIVIED
jgi:ferredoxin